MKTPSREEALKALDKISSDYDLAGGWSPDPMPLLATLRSYIEPKAPLNMWPGDNDVEDASPVQPDTALTEALTRIEELEGALRPFAGLVGEGVEDYADDHPVTVIIGRSTYYSLKLGCLRRAAEAVGGGE